ncbi:MAG: hypothetical protein U0414_06980 [Polyangiaceae bacterium]
MRSGFLASFLSLFVASVSHAALAEDAVTTDDRSFAERGVYPVLLTGSMAMAPDGMEGRWGLGVERHPSRPAAGESFSGLGLGFGAEAGFSVLGSSADGDPNARPGARAGWFAPIARPGWFFASRKDGMTIAGALGVGLAPIVDVLETGDAHLTLSAQPGFEMGVEHFAFGLAMMLNGRVVSTDSETGFGVGVKVGLGASI